MSGNDEETSMREDMEAAIEALEDDEQTAAPVDEGSGEANAPDEPPEPESAGEQTVSAEPGHPPDDKKPLSLKGAKPDEKPAQVKAPNSWNPELREKFATLPPEIQAIINKRETEINRGLNDGAANRKLGEQFNQVMQPFQSVLAAEGAQDPMQALQGLMSTAAELRMGSPQQKAQRMAAMIQHYGIDIGMLDNALVGGGDADPETQKMEELLNQKLQPVTEFMQNIGQMQQQNQTQQQQKAASEIQQFEQQAEFISDVRNDMADLLDLAAKRGIEMSLQEAYDKACAMHPEISKVLGEREQAERLKQAGQTTQQKKAAATSIHGNQTGAGGGTGDLDLRGQLESAWDEQVRR